MDARRLILASAALLLAAAARAAEPLQRWSPAPNEWLASCPVPRSPAPSDKLPVASRPADKPYVGVIREDIVAYEEARRRTYQGIYKILEVVRGNDCGQLNGALSALIEAHDQAFEESKAAALALYAEGDVEWVPSKSAAREPPGRRAPDKWEQACKRPEAPWGASVPQAGPAASADLKRSVSDLAQDTQAYNDAVRNLHAGVSDMLRLEHAFRCRQVLEAYDQAVSAYTGAFRQRVDEGFARFVRAGLKWSSGD